VRLHPPRLEPARQPEAVAPGFEGQCNPRDLFTGPGRLIAPAIQQAIAGASLARRAVNLPLSVLKPGCGSRALCGSKLRRGVKNARPKSRNRKFESISLQRGVSCEPELRRLSAHARAAEPPSRAADAEALLAVLVDESAASFNQASAQSRAPAAFQRPSP
jgi:hypothetical protein